MMEIEQIVEKLENEVLAAKLIGYDVDHETGLLNFRNPHTDKVEISVYVHHMLMLYIVEKGVVKFSTKNINKVKKRLIEWL